MHPDSEVVEAARGALDKWYVPKRDDSSLSFVPQIVLHVGSEHSIPGGVVFLKSVREAVFGFIQGCYARR